MPSLSSTTFTDSLRKSLRAETIGMDYGGIPSYVFAYFYIPLMALMLCFILNIVLALLFSLVFPLLLEEDRSSVFSIVNLAWKLIPYGSLINCVVIICYKGMSCIAEACVDAFRREKGMAYYVLAHRSLAVASSPLQLGVFLTMLTLSLAVFGFHAWSNQIMVWEWRDSEVLLCAWTVMLSQALYFIVMILSQSSGISAKLVFQTYWQKYIPKTRRNIVLILAIFVVRWMVYFSVPHAFPWLLETMLYLISPHVFLCYVLSLVRTVVHFVEAIKWLIHHPSSIVECVITSSISASLLIVMVAHFQTVYVTIIATYTWMLVLARVVSMLDHSGISYDEDDNETIVWLSYGAGGAFFERWEVIPWAQASIIESQFQNKVMKPFPVDEIFSCDLEKKIMYFTQDPNHGWPIKRKERNISQVRTVFENIVSLVFMHSAPEPNPSLRTARRITKFLIGFLVCMLLMLVVATILQTSLTATFQPTSIHAHSNEDLDYLRIDHFVVDMVFNSSEDGFEDPNSMMPRDKYGVCSRRWYGLNAMDLAWFSILTYFEELSTGFNTTLAFYKKHHLTANDWVYQEKRATSTDVKSWVVFQEYYSPSYDVTVLAVRGTDIYSARDMIQDVNMYVEVGLYHVVANLIPGISLLPSALISDYIKFASLVENIGDPQVWKSSKRSSGTSSTALRRHYWTDVLEASQKIMEAHNHSSKHRLVLTGHSMGGAIAHIVAAQLGAQAIAMSSPGIMLSHKKFSLPIESMYRNVNLVPRHDIVPKVDSVVGEVHHIDCAARRKDVCHAVEFTLMEIWKGCPSLRQITTLRSVHEYQHENIK